MVEGAALCLGTSSVWHLGWSFHHLHDQHFRSCALFTDWLACGKCIIIVGYISMSLGYTLHQFTTHVVHFKYLQGNTGVLLGMLLVSLVVLVALVTVMSGIGVSECCSVGNGGVYSMVSTVLGGRVGGTVGLLYVFGQVSKTCINDLIYDVFCILKLFTVFVELVSSVSLELCTSLVLQSPSLRC